MIQRLILLALMTWLAVTPATAQTGKDYYSKPPPMPSAKLQPAISPKAPSQASPQSWYEQAMKDMEAQDALRPKAVKPKTQEDAAAVPAERQGR